MRKTVIKKAIMPKKTKKVVSKKNQKTVKKVKADAQKKLIYPSWTKPKHLTENDHKDLKRFYELFLSGKIISAFSFASNFDTIVREAIPPDVWKQSGGSLTPKGKEGLKKNEKKTTKHPSPPQGENTPYTNALFNKGVFIEKESLEMLHNNLTNLQISKEELERLTLNVEKWDKSNISEINEIQSVLIKISIPIWETKQQING